ncbi:response regulator transcription factor [uncultured Clostridium sp.]|jgi:DNA-binding response OmpR family regulator|uniref:response regulator transcription factor n=1 Tax=uncultured Clostridium sp. TaxID=59620 RepID=UPI0026268A8F|nr:response regulator transcription factor [uncultured Clostridium sp.]
MHKIVIVEDSEVIREELKTFLERNGYEVIAVDRFENVIEDIKKAEGDLVLLDINLPVFDGYYICREIRKESNIPVIVVTSRNSEIDELMSMNLGADDFVTKPYNTQILLARIEAVLKRSKGNTEDNSKLTFLTLELNLESGEILNKNGGKRTEISKNEMKILAYLIKNKNKIVSREDLMNYLWSTDFFVDDNTLSVNITRLRKKLESVGISRAIETRRGLGYIMSE